MTDEGFDLRFGLSQSGSQRFRDLEGSFAGLDERLERILEMRLDQLTTNLESAIREEFISGTDSQGVSHNKTGYTLSTLTAHTAGFDASIEMGGGAPFVEFGSVPHEIPNAFGWGITVWHPGYVGDDFIGRAIHDDWDLSFELRRMALEARAELVRHGEYGTSVGALEERA